jgi:hypothetical protein
MSTTHTSIVADGPNPERETKQPPAERIDSGLMSTPQQPPEDPGAPQPGPAGSPDGVSPENHVQVSPLLDDDPPKVGDFWLDARLGSTPSGVAYTGHDDTGRGAMIILLSEGAAADAAARDRLAGVVNQLHIDVVYARGGHGQDFGRLGRTYQGDPEAPVSPDQRQVAPWAALAYDGSPAAAAEAERILDEVQLAALPHQGHVAGPDYTHYWIDRVKPGLTRLWPLPWPGRYDRAGWRTILVSWLLMLLLATLAVLLAILIFRHQPPEAPPPPTGSSASPPPSSSSASPQTGSPPPQSASPSPSPTPSGSASPSPASPSPDSPSPGSPTPGSASPSESPPPGGSPDSTSPGSPGNTSPGSRL